MKELPLAAPALAACALDAVGMAEHGARYAALGRPLAASSREPAALVADFDERVDLALLAEAVAIERGCCSFFGIELDGRRLRMTVVDPMHAPALDAIADARGT